MKTAVIIKPKEPLQIQDRETPKPKGPQVLVRVESCGVCHSDIHLWEGGYEGPGGQFLKTTERGVRYPLVPGHEIAGVIDAIGEGVQDKFKKGDRVIVYPWIGEGLCPACRAGDENLCDDPRSIGIYNNGGYAEYILVSNYRYLVGIDDAIDTEAASTLSCSALTAFTAVKNAELRESDNLVIVGTGGVGLMAIQLAKAVSGARTIAVDIDDGKLKIAKDNGADEIVNSKKEGEPAKIVKEGLTSKNGADAVIDFVNSSQTVETDMQFLRRRAKLVLVGFFGGELKLNLITMPTKAYRLIGSYTGNLADMVELVSLAKRGIIKPIVSDRFKLEQATEALSKLKEGKVVGRGVINP